MLRVHYSNRAECLADALAGVLLAPTAAPLSVERVVVPHPGIGRWLATALATRRGVVANVRFELPAAFVWSVLDAAVPDLPERSPFAPAALRLAVLGRLDEVADGADEVANYLAAADPLMRYELASGIARCLDTYLVYRPDWIRGWEAGRDRHWQARLWRSLVKAHGPAHWVAASDRLRAGLAAGGAPALGDPVHVFALSSFSPAYLELLAELAGGASDAAPVHFYALNPCREYWGDLIPARLAARRSGTAEPESLYYARGNPLLASFGRVGRELVDALTELGGEETERYVSGAASPGAGPLLAALQDDVLELRDGTRLEAGGKRRIVDGDDESVQLHVCHGPVREMEVLHDRLLALFERPGGLDPGAVVVLTPRIERYCAAIEAVFGSGSAAPRIPYAIVDRTAVAELPLVAAYLRLLEVAEGRLGSDEVLGALGHPAVRRRFRIDEDALASLRRIVAEAGIRWGADGAARAGLGFGPDDAYTWSFGLDRLALGVAMVGDGRLVGGLAPFDGLEAGDAELLGQLFAFAEALFALAGGLASPHRLSEWSQRLRRALATFLDPRGPEESEAHALLTGIAALDADAELAGFDQAVPFAVARAHLLAALGERGRAQALGAQLFTGRVTFGELVPLRSIPFDVVCLVGLDDGAFPRPDRRLGFDLTQRDPRRGDRSARDDDRYLFLESLLAARRHLYLSYGGLDARDDTLRPPSPVVAELLEYVDGAFGDEGGGLVSQRLVHRHPLQPFSPAYFEPGARIFSYDAAALAAARALVGEPAAPATLFAAALDEPEDEWRSPGLAAFVRFFEHPVRHLLRERLGVRPGEPEEELRSSEPFLLDGLSRYVLRQRLLDWGERPGDDVGQLAAGAALVPAGEAGRAQAAGERAVVADYARRLAAAAEIGCPAALDVALSPGRLRLAGTLPLAPGGRLGRARARDRLTAWVRHLLANAALGPRTSAHVFVDTTLRFAPVEGAGEHLAALGELYWRGLSSPLALFPESAYAFASKGSNRLAARRAWEGSGRERGPPPERDDPYHALAFAGTDPLDRGFEALALAVFEPLLAHCAEEPVDPARGRG